MVWIEKQNIKVGVGGQLAAAITAQRDHGAHMLCLVRRVIDVAKQGRSLIGAFHYQVENRTARRSSLTSWGTAAMRDLQALILNFRKVFNSREIAVASPRGRFTEIG